jgi:hypothetical protein
VSAISLLLLAAAALAVVLGGAALHSARGLHRELTALRRQLAADSAREAATRSAAVPAARAAPVEEIRSAVAEALAEERERELAEARAFWAAQEARDAGEGPLLAGHGMEYEVAPGMDETLLEALLEGRLDGLEGLHGLPDSEVFIPRQSEGEAAEPLEEQASGTEHGTESAELAAARRRHPSQPDYTLSGDPVVPGPGAPGAQTVADHERTVERLGELADSATPLVDVRPGPLGTLDVYLFEDGTTLCMSPGHRETAERLADALDAGLSPVLLGGSGVSGAFSLTFTVGDEQLYALADRIIASHGI